MKDRKTIAFVLPHPDDEALALGLPAQLKMMGHDVVLISMTRGDLGSHTLISRRKIARIRKEEFRKAGEILGTPTRILPFPDGDLEHHKRKAERKLLREFRTIQPDVVITTDKNDYHSDHQITHDVASWAAFNMPAAPITTRRGIFRKPIPLVVKDISFYSMDTQGSQQLSNTRTDDGVNMENLHPVNTILPLSQEAIDLCTKAFMAHVSQLLPRDAQLGYITLAQLGAQRRGKEIGSKYGVGLTLESFGGYKFSPNNVLLHIFRQNNTR